MKMSACKKPTVILGFKGIWERTYCKTIAVNAVEVYSSHNDRRTHTHRPHLDALMSVSFSVSH